MGRGNRSRVAHLASARHIENESESEEGQTESRRTGHRTSFVVPAMGNEGEVDDRGSLMANPKSAADKAIRDFFEWTSLGQGEDITWLKVSPNSFFVTSWNLLAFFGSLFSIIAIPFYLAFGSKSRYLGSSPLQDQYGYVVIIYLVDIFFVVDIWLHFYLPYLNSDCDVEVRKARIQRKYRRSALFKINVFSVFPFELLFSWFNLSAPVNAQWNFLTTFRLFQLNRLLRIFVLLSKLSHISRSLSMMSEIKRIVSMLCSFLCAAHVFACIFFLIGRLELEASTWIEEPWLLKYGVSDGDSRLRKYMLSIYWSMMTMVTVGYGDVCRIPLSSASLRRASYLLGQLCTPRFSAASQLCSKILTSRSEISIICSTS